MLFAASTLITLVLVVLWQHGQARVDSLNPNSQAFCEVHPCQPERTP
jgi:hypothetical protein